MLKTSSIVADIQNIFKVPGAPAAVEVPLSEVILIGIFHTCFDFDPEKVPLVNDSVPASIIGATDAVSVTEAPQINKKKAPPFLEASIIKHIMFLNLGKENGSRKIEAS